MNFAQILRRTYTQAKDPPVIKAPPQGEDGVKAMITRYRTVEKLAQLRRECRALRQDRRGLAAVEFAMIAAPFFILLFGLIEISMLFVVSTILDHGVSDAARDIRTGAFQRSSDPSPAAFKTEICSQMADLFGCDSNLYITVSAFDQFAAYSETDVIDEDGKLDTSSFQFDSSQLTRNKVVVVRAYFTWNLFTPAITAPLANMSDDRRLIQSTMVFRNEPF